jgi:hypothetical protein
MTPSSTLALLRCSALTLLISACAPTPRPIESPTPPGEVTPIESSREGARFLRDVARTAQGSGAGPLKTLNFGAGTTGDRLDGLVFVPASTCALFIARSSETIEDLDLHIYGDDGTQYGVDESPDDLPTLLLCPDSDVRLFASARVAQGHGLMALGVQTVPTNRSSEVAKAVGARNFSSSPQEVDEAWPGLQQAIDDRREQLGGTWSDLRQVALPVDARVPTHLTVDIPRQRCLDVLLLPTDDVSQLNVAASDESGRIVARGVKQANKRTLLLCSPKQDRRLSLVIRPYAGRGLAVAALSLSKQAPRELEFDPEVIPYFLDSAGPTPEQKKLPQARASKLLKIKRGTITSWDTTLKGCERIELYPDDALSAYEVRVWGEDGKLLAEEGGNGPRSLFICAKGKVRIDAEAPTRSGSLTLEFRHAPEASKALQKLPLAASRLLAQAFRSGMLSSPEQIGKVNQVQLKETRLLKIPLSIPVAHCQTVFVAGDEGTWGIEARIYDTSTGLELDLAQGARSVTARACAGRGAHRNAQLELRATRGEAHAFWAARQEQLPPRKAPK